MEQRTERLSPEDRAMLRRRAIGVSLLAIPMFAAVTFMVWFALDGFLPVAGQALFFTFFVGILLFIVGVHVRNALDTEALVLTGIITDKRTRLSTQMNRSSASTTWYISLDGTEQMADQATFHAVAKGQKVDLWTSPSTGNIHRVVVLEGALPARDEALALEPAPQDGCLSDEQRGIVWGRLGVAVFWRGLGGAVLAFVVYVVLLIVAVLVLVDVIGTLALARVVLYGCPAVAIGLWLLINGHTYRTVRDLWDGRTLVYREVVCDVVRSNTTLLGPHASLHGPGLEGPFTYVQTDRVWAAIDPAVAEGVATGSTVLVTVTMRSSIVLDVRPVRGVE